MGNITGPWAIGLLLKRGSGSITTLSVSLVPTHLYNLSPPSPLLCPRAVEKRTALLGRCYFLVMLLLYCATGMYNSHMDDCKLSEIKLAIGFVTTHQPMTRLRLRRLSIINRLFSACLSRVSRVDVLKCIQTNIPKHMLHQGHFIHFIHSVTHFKRKDTFTF